MKRSNKKKLEQARQANADEQQKLCERLDYADKKLSDVLERLKKQLAPAPPVRLVK